VTLYERRLPVVSTSYSRARANLARLMDEVVEDRQVVIIRRRGSEPVAMLAASELAGLEETAHLLRSPANARRLLRALARADEGREKPSTIEQLRREVGLDRERP
jgi:antitoxin YefM